MATSPKTSTERARKSRRRRKTDWERLLDEFALLRQAVERLLEKMVS